jgi:hypothetical protein|tara:strand:+ start:159 stop:758 length:600 start_codon:yes stop_codon:yes gene_type:complete
MTDSVKGNSLAQQFTSKTDNAKKFWYDQSIDYLSWMQKTCVYHRCLWDHLDIPAEGKIVQLGVGFGLSLELLYQRFGARTMGIDIFNYCDHPVLYVQDIRETKDFKLAYVHCNVGNFNTTPSIRKHGLEWSLRNLVPGGKCVTAGNDPWVDSELGINMKKFASVHDCHVLDIPNDPLITKMNQIGKYHSKHDCIIVKNQ